MQENTYGTVIYGSHDEDFHFKLVGAIWRLWDLFRLCLKASHTFVHLGCFSWHQKPLRAQHCKIQFPFTQVLSWLHWQYPLCQEEMRKYTYIYVMWKTYCSSNFSSDSHNNLWCCWSPIMHCNIERVHEPTAKIFVVTYGILFSVECVSLCFKGI